MDVLPRAAGRICAIWRYLHVVGLGRWDRLGGRCWVVGLWVRFERKSCFGLKSCFGVEVVFPAEVVFPDAETAWGADEPCVLIAECGVGVLCVAGKSMCGVTGASCGTVAACGAASWGVVRDALEGPPRPRAGPIEVAGGLWVEASGNVLSSSTAVLYMVSPFASVSLSWMSFTSDAASCRLKLPVMPVSPSATLSPLSMDLAL